MIPLSRPDHPDDPAALLTTLREIILSGRWTQGEYGASFERQVAEVCGSIYAVATNSGTSALEAICNSLGLKVGDEVICPSYTFIATVNALLACGAKPVFADIDPRTFNLDLESVAAKRTDKTKAVLLVHQFGIPADGASFAHFCCDHDLFLIEDAACGLGSKWDGKSVSTFGIAGLLSFHPRKVLSTGEGGMVLTDRENVAARARAFGNHGRAPGENEAAAEPGHNYRMSEFQAALGLWALERFPEAVSRRVEAAHRYDEGFKDFEKVAVVVEPGRADWNRQSYPVRVPGDCRDRVAETLAAEKIQTSPGPLPAHMHPYIEARLHPPRLPHSEAAYAQTLLLPMFAAITPNQQARVIEALRAALK